MSRFMVEVHPNMCLRLISKKGYRLLIAAPMHVLPGGSSNLGHLEGGGAPSSIFASVILNPG